MKQFNLTPQQLRAALAYLGWGSEELAIKVDMSRQQIGNILRGQHAPQGENAAAIKNTLERHGIKFTESGGIEPDHGFARIIEGPTAYPETLAFIAETMTGQPEAEALFFYVDNSKSSAATVAAHEKLRETVKCRYLCSEHPARLDFPARDYRAVPERFFHNAPKVIFGDYIAQVFSNDPPRVQIIRGHDLAQSDRLTFEHLWSICKVPEVPA